MKIRKGDLVKLISGSEEKKGKIGRVLQVDVEAGRVTVEGIGMHKKHLKPQRDQKHPEGGIVEKLRSVHVSNVMLMSESLGRPVRTGVKLTDDGKKIRVAKGRNLSAEAV